MSIRFGETIECKKHGSKLQKAEHEIILRNCRTGGFCEDGFSDKDNIKLPLNLTREHVNMISGIVEGCRKAAPGHLQILWSDGDKLWAKVANDAIVRRTNGDEKKTTDPRSNTDPFSADIILVLTGIFTGRDGRSHVQLTFCVKSGGSDPPKTKEGTETIDKEMPITLLCITDEMKHKTFKHEPDTLTFTKMSIWQIQNRISGRVKNNKIHVDGETYIPVYGYPSEPKNITRLRENMPENWENELEER